MEVRNVTRDELQDALMATNKQFDGNVIWNRAPEYMGRTRQGANKYRLTLRVSNSHGKGARLGHSDYQTGKQRHLVSACWHVHGTFMDSLPDGAEIVVNGPRGRQVKYPGDYWEDYNIGSSMYPMMYSDACECEW